MTTKVFDGSHVTFRIIGRNARTGTLVDIVAMIVPPVGPRTVQQAAEDFAAELLCGGTAKVTRINDAPND